MKTEHLYRSLATYPSVLRPLVENIPIDQLGWKPCENDWSILEIVCHLRDEENEDFSKRLFAILEDPEKNWDPIDTVGWVTSRTYSAEKLHPALDQFEEARARNLNTLINIKGDWNSEKTLPRLGTIKAGDLLKAWAAHDLLHLRQIIKMQYQYINEENAEYSSGYAGGRW